MIEPPKLQAAVKGEIPTDAWLTNHFHFSNRVCRPLWKTALNFFWEEVEDTLTSVETVYRYVVQDPKFGAANKATLDTPQGRRWLNQMCHYFYAFLRLYTFGASCPICHEPLDALKDAWEKYTQGYYHSACVRRLEAERQGVH